MSTDEGKIILFEEVLFCSDILKNELSPYNVNLSAHLIAPPFSSVEFEKLPKKNIQDVYNAPSLVKKEQARLHQNFPFGTHSLYMGNILFYIKTIRAQTKILIAF
jgi:hypothetical protein